MSDLGAIAAVVLLLTAALGIGSKLESYIPSTFSRFDHFTLVFCGGVGLLGTLLFDVGQVWYTRVSAFSLLTLCIALGWVRFRRLPRLLRSAHWAHSIPIVPGIVLMGIFALTAVGGLVNPTGGTENDAVTYHFLGPRVWLREGKIRPVLDQCLTAFPSIAESQYGAGMALGGQRAPELFAVVSLLIILLVTAGLASRMGLDLRSAAWVAALTATMPAVYFACGRGMIDALYAAFVLAAVRIGFDATEMRHYALFGLFCGFAMGTKYTGLIAWPILLVCVFTIVRHAKGISLGNSLRGLGVSALVTAWVATPFYARNWILLGVPIYPPTPLLEKFFRPRYLAPGSVQQFYEYILKRGQGMGHGFLNFLLLPFHLTFHTANFNGAGGIGLVPLALGPFGLLACRRDWFARAIGAMGLMLTVAWYLTDQESRFLVAVYALTAIFGAMGWRYVERLSPKRGAFLALVTVVLSVSYGVFMIGSAKVDDVHAAISPRFAAQRSEKEIPFDESFRYLNDTLFVGKVLILNPHVPAFYLKKAYVKPWGERGEQALPGAPDLKQVLSELSQLGISHILDVRFGGSSYELPDHPRGLTLVFERPDQRIYRVTSDVP